MCEEMSVELTSDRVGGWWRVGSLTVTGVLNEHQHQLAQLFFTNQNIFRWRPMYLLKTQFGVRPQGVDLDNRKGSRKSLVLIIKLMIKVKL